MTNPTTPLEPATPDNGRLTPKLLAWLGAKQLSDISASVNMIVISVYALALFKDPWVLGIVLALRMVGSVVGAFAVPALAHRFSHGVILIACDVAGALLMFLLAFAPKGSHADLLLILPFFMGLFHGGFHVALYSQAKHFLGTERRLKMNSILAMMDGVAVVAGSALAGFIYDLVAIETIFLIDGTTFLLSGLVFALLGREFLKHSEAEKEELASPIASLKKAPMALIRSLMAAVGLIILARFMEAFGSSTHNLGFPILSADYTPANEAFLVGWIMAFWGVGKMVATLLTTRFVAWLHRMGLGDEQAFILFLILTFGLFLGVFAASHLAIILLFAFLAGLFDASTETVYYSILQVAKGARTDILVSLSYLIERAGMGLGILLIGHVFSILPTFTSAAFFYGGSMLVCALILLLVSMRRADPSLQIQEK